MEFTLRAPATRAPLPGLALRQARIVVHAHAHVGPLQDAAALVDEIGELQDRGVRAALLHGEKEVTVALHGGAVPSLEPGRVARQPAEPNVVALVETHERGEAARPGAPGNES